LKKCNAEVFVESLLVPCLKSSELAELLKLLFQLNNELSSNKLVASYLTSIGKYLEKNGYLNTLYYFQLQMKVSTSMIARQG
jgi:hypothetical protein